MSSITGKETGIYSFTTAEVTEGWTNPVVRRLCELVLTSPAPLALNLQVTSDNLTSFLSPKDAVLLVGDSESACIPQSGLGGVIVNYGSGNSRKRLIADARSGCYSLGVGDFLSVDAFAYVSPFTFVFSNPCTIGATAWPGQVNQPARFRNTIGRTLSSGSTNAFGVPDKARWLDVYGNIEGLDAANPVVTVRGEDTQLIVRDWTQANGYVPSWGPVELGHARDLTVVQSNTGAAAEDIYLQFFLEP